MSHFVDVGVAALHVCVCTVICQCQRVIVVVVIIIGALLAHSPAFRAEHSSSLSFNCPF